MQQLLQEREAERAREMIQNEMYLSKHKALADAEHYRFVSITTDTFPTSSQAQSEDWESQTQQRHIDADFAAGHTSQCKLLEILRGALLLLCRVMKEAEANVQKLTPEFLQMSYMKAISNNTKMYFGNKLPSMLLELHQILPALQGQLQH